jgi:hypothetical protein
MFAYSLFSRRGWTRILGRNAGAASLQRVSGVILAVAPSDPLRRFEALPHALMVESRFEV